MLVAAFMNLWNTNEEFRTAITGIWNDIVSKVKGFCDQLTQRINGLGFDFKDITDVLKTIWDASARCLHRCLRAHSRILLPSSALCWIP